MLKILLTINKEKIIIIIIIIIIITINQGMHGMTVADYIRM